MAKKNRPSLYVRIIIVLIAATIIWYGVRIVRNLLFDESYNLPGHTFAAVSTTLLAVPLALFARRYLDKRPLSGLGLPLSRRAVWQFLGGALCWLVPAIIGMGACLLFGWADITLQTSVAEAVRTTLVLVGLVFLYEALPEELLFRGYFFRNFAAQFPIGVAAVLQALLFTGFGMAIGAAGSGQRVLVFFVFALLLAHLRILTGSIWAGIGFHVAFQVVAQLLSYVGNHQFTVNNLPMLEIISYGILPFTSSFILVGHLRKQRKISLATRERE